MRPFIATLLKCTRCNSEKVGRLCPEKVQKITMPAYLPSIPDIGSHQDFLLDLIESVSRVGGSLIDISEADLHLFMECCTDDAGTQEALKMVELLYGIDIVEGTIHCSSSGCNATKTIRNSILFCEE